MTEVSIDKEKLRKGLLQTLERFGTNFCNLQVIQFRTHLKSFMDTDVIYSQKIAVFLGHPDDQMLELWLQGKNLPDWRIMLEVLKFLERYSRPG